MRLPITAEERDSFRRCRRRWDLGARSRQALEPIGRAVEPDLDRAVRDALAVYYFPGMWDWSRQIVQPLVLEALRRSIASQRAACFDARPITSDLEHEWREPLATGERLLGAYLGWAPSVDHFAPIRVEGEYEVLIADPRDPERGLGIGPAGRSDTRVLSTCWRSTPPTASGSPGIG